MANQKKRKQKISAGTAVGSRKTKLSELQKVLMGKGILDPMHQEAAAKKYSKRD